MVHRHVHRLGETPEDMNNVLDVTYINRELETLPYILNDDYYDAVMECWKVYNPLTGPVQSISTYHGARGGAPVYVGHSEYYNADEVLGKIAEESSMTTGVKQSLFAGGKGITLPDMVLGSLGEVIERIIGAYAFFDTTVEIIYGTYDSLKAKGVPCIEPEKISLFHEEQYKEKHFRYKPFTRESMLGWIKGKGLVSGEDIYLPAQLVMIFYKRKPQEDKIGYSTTGGLDSHINMHEAIYHGICELIERDAINVRWVCKIPPEKIALNRKEITSQELMSLLDSVQGLPLQMEYYYHSLDITEVSVVTAIAIDHYFNKYAYYPGGGADANLEKAIVKAVTELAQAERNVKLVLLFPMREHSASISRILGIGEDDPVSKIDIFFKVVTLYGYKKNLEKLAWHLSGNKSLSLESVHSKNLTSSHEKYDFILDVMRKHKIDPIFFDFTPDPFKTLKLVKVFIPELTLPFIASFPYLGHPRYLELPGQLGLFHESLTYKELVKDPQPYP